MTYLEKLTATASSYTATPPLTQIVSLAGPAAPPDDPAADKVLSALEDLRDLRLLLAWDPDDDGDDDSSKSGDTDKDYAGKGKGGKAKPKGKGGWSDDDNWSKKGKKPSGKKDDEDDDEDDDNWSKKGKKKVKASALVDSAILALSGLALPQAWDGSGELKLSVLTQEQREKPSAHTISGSTDYPIPDKGHLQAAVARYKEGKLAGHSKSEVAAHIRAEAKRLGVQVDI